jgi:hypothetical protein
MNISTWKVSSNDVTSRLRRLEGAYPKTNHTSPTFSKAKFVLPSSTAVLPSGQINPISAVQAKGNLSPMVLSGVLGFSSDGGSITVWWDGTNSSQVISVKRADGTSFTVPKGTQTISGLTASTLYGFSVFWNINNTGGLSFGPGDTGTPKVAISPAAGQAVINQAIQVQQSFDAEPIYSGLVYWSTTAGGGGSSGAGTNQSGGALGSVRPRGFSTL